MRHRFKHDGEWISRLPDVGGDRPERQRFKRYPIGFFHIDIAELQTVEGKLFLFVGIDRTRKFAVNQLVDKADRKTAWEVLEHRSRLSLTAPIRSSPPLGIMPCMTLPGSGQRHPVRRAAPEPEYSVFAADAVRHDLRGQRHRASAHQAKPPLEFPRDGQVERMNRTIKDATVKRYHHDSHDQLRTHLADVILRRGQQSTGLSA